MMKSDVSPVNFLIFSSTHCFTAHTRFFLSTMFVKMLPILTHPSFPRQTREQQKKKMSVSHSADYVAFTGQVGSFSLLNSSTFIQTAKFMWFEAPNKCLSHANLETLWHESWKVGFVFSRKKPEPQTVQEGKSHKSHVPQGTCFSNPTSNGGNVPAKKSSFRIMLNLIESEKKTGKKDSRTATMNHPSTDGWRREIAKTASWPCSEKRLALLSQRNGSSQNSLSGCHLVETSESKNQSNSKKLGNVLTEISICMNGTMNPVLESRTTNVKGQRCSDLCRSRQEQATTKVQIDEKKLLFPIPKCNFS